MGIFSKHSRTETSTTIATLIAKGCHANGQLKVEGDIQVDGFIEGRIDVKGTLVVSESGRIKGEVFSSKLVVNGLVEGECTSSNIEVLAKGRLNGKVSCHELCIEPGGKFIGENSEMAPNDVTSIHDKKVSSGPEAKTNKPQKKQA
ncbi:bactofilin family protein [Vibrio agarivorans]|uniref:bactofilin family protein n=1 Tax=Vibrio agarivorans TaxID=153622 RepID=UPI0025B448F5|nr:polymer-forming cytoskeletal protein [Vibrio agarivorans]MDN3659975.1 polymer-forming cytoskeletal protein [Vibrio agarivorans]